MSVSDKDSLFPIGLDAVVLECRDVKKLADFYAKLIGWQPHYQEEGEWVDLYSPNSQVKIAFQYNPEHLPPVWPDEPGQQQQQLHLDFTVNSPQQLQEAVNHALACGAVLTKDQYGKGISPEEDKFITLLDPEGHPFCFVLW